MGALKTFLYLFRGKYAEDILEDAPTTPDPNVCNKLLAPLVEDCCCEVKGGVDGLESTSSSLELSHFKRRDANESCTVFTTEG